MNPVKKLTDLIESHGFVLVRKKKHFVYKRGPLMFVVPKTPTCPRSLKNSEMQFLRMLRAGDQSTTSPAGAAPNSYI